jgi:signal transduction histidine kinase
VYDIVEVGQGHLWLANQQAGLLHLFQKHMVQQIPWAGLGHTDLAMTLAAAPSGKGLWLGFFDGGVAYFADGGIQKSYSAAQGLGQGWVTGLRFDPGGALWADTQGGLSRIKDDRITTLTSKNGLPCDGVHWSIEDDDNSVWLYMPCGLARIARSELDAWASDPARIVKTTVFDTSDGVPNSPLPGSFAHRVTKSSDGKLWFVTQDGVGIIDPHHLAFNKLPPPVHIEQITADDKTYDATNGLRLPPRIHYLSIDYTALSLTIPEKVRFRYKLEGEDKNWREVGNVRHVEYTNLPPKHYRFRVLASNNSGVWNEQGAALEFVIPPAWYQTNWFRVACLAAFALLLWALYRLRVRQLAYQFNMRLEERVGERTRIARDLHDTLLQSFQALLPRLQAAIYKLPESPVEARKTLEVAVDQASEAITEGRDAVQGLRLSTVEQNDLALAIRTVGEELASADDNQSSSEFNVVVEGTSRNLHPILRDEVYRLAAEALRNAFRHAAARSIEVEIRYDERQFRLRIRDDGKGIGDEVLRAEERKGHYGLPGMKERAGLVGGKLTIWSEVDNGTEIELVIPASRAYAQPTRRLWKFGKRSAEDVDVKETINRE